MLAKQNFSKNLIFKTEEDVPVYKLLEKNMKKYIFLDPEKDPAPLVRGTDPGIHTKMSRMIPNKNFCLFNY
jgi:hypothetical protein